MSICKWWYFFKLFVGLHILPNWPRTHWPGPNWPGPNWPHPNWPQTQIGPVPNWPQIRPKLARTQIGPKPKLALNPNWPHSQIGPEPKLALIPNWPQAWIGSGPKLALIFLISSKKLWFFLNSTKIDVVLQSYFAKLQSTNHMGRFWVFYALPPNIDDFFEILNTPSPQVSS